MKAQLIIFIFCILVIRLSAQTREADYNFIINYYTQNASNDQYRIASLISSEIARSGSIKTRLEFVSVYTKSDNKRRAMAMIYKEFIHDNELDKIRVYCIPESNSDSLTTAKCFQDIQQINDQFIETYLMWGLMKLVVK